MQIDLLRVMLDSLQEVKQSLCPLSVIWLAAYIPSVHALTDLPG